MISILGDNKKQQLVEAVNFLSRDTVIAFEVLPVSEISFHVHSLLSLPEDLSLMVDFIREKIKSSVVRFEFIVICANLDRKYVQDLIDLEKELGVIIIATFE